jgi:hypothetical protein
MVRSVRRMSNKGDHSDGMKAIVVPSLFSSQTCSQTWLVGKVLARLRFYAYRESKRTSSSHSGSRPPVSITTNEVVALTQL